MPASNKWWRTHRLSVAMYVLLSIVEFLTFLKPRTKQRKELGYITERLPAACPVLISAVITSCNEDLSVLDRSVKSFLNQGYIGVSEIIIVHDACNVRKFDAYSRRLKSRGFKVTAYSDRESSPQTQRCEAGTVKLIQREQNGGLGASRNTGVRVSKGLFVWPIDADDYLNPHLLSTLFRRAKRDRIDLFEDVNIIMPGMGRGRYGLLQWQPKSPKFTDVTRENVFHCCGMIRRDIFSQVEYNEALVWGWEDWDFWINVDQKIGIREYILPGGWYVYTSAHTATSMSNFCFKNFEVCKALLHLANHEKYASEQIKESRAVLKSQGYVLWNSAQWSHIVRAGQQSNLAKVLKDVAPPDVNVKHVQSNLCTEIHRNISRTTPSFALDFEAVDALLQSMRQAEQESYHQIISVCTTELYLKLVMHSVIGILKADSCSVVIVHYTRAAETCARTIHTKLVEEFSVQRVYFASTDIERLAARADSDDTLRTLKSRQVKSGAYYYSHVTDFMRYCLLYVFGGVYLDTDILLLKSPRGLCNMCRESEGVVNGAFLAFPARHAFVKRCLEKFRTAYDTKCWGCVGPLLITSTMREFKDTVNICGEDAFYKIHYSNWKSMYNEPVSDEVFHDPRVYGYHLWNKLSHGRVKMVPSSIAERILDHTCVQRGSRMCLANE